MRIAFFSDAYHPRVSGQVSSLDEFCKSLTERGHEVRIVCPTYQAKRMTHVVDDSRVIRVPSGSAIVSKDDRLAYPWRKRKVLHALRDFDPHVVHVQTEFSIGAIGRRWCRKKGMPIISTCHTFYEMYVGWYLPFLPAFCITPVVRMWLKNVYRNDSMIITPSRRIRDVLRRYEIDKEYAIIPTGVDGRRFHPQPAAAAKFRASLEHTYPFVKNALLLMYAGRITEEKNLDMLARAMKRITSEKPHAVLIMAGDGPKAGEIRERFTGHGLGSHVVWLGLVAREMLPAMYSAADVFVFPSVTETQGLVTVEAMLCGTPVVGVNRMGTAEIMEGDRGGYLAENDPDDFAEKVLMLLRDPELRTRKSAEALRHGHDYTIDKACDEIEIIYRRLSRE